MQGGRLSSNYKMAQFIGILIVFTIPLPKFQFFIPTIPFFLKLLIVTEKVTKFVNDYRLALPHKNCLDFHHHPWGAKLVSLRKFNVFSPSQIHSSLNMWTFSLIWKKLESENLNTQLEEIMNLEN